MESVIDHCCYTFMREILVWKTKINGKTAYLQSYELSDEARRNETGIFMVLNPEYPGIKTSKTGFRPCEKLDLTLSDDAFQVYSRYKNDPFGKPEEILNTIPLHFQTSQKSILA